MDPTRDAIITALSSIQGANKPLTAAALAERLQEPIPLEDAVAAGWIEQVGEFVQLTPAALGDATGAWTRSMQAGFGKTLVRAMNSPAYQAFNVRVYGTERFQFNMIDPEQAERIANFGNLGPGKRFVDLGCATGTMTAWIADHTGAAGVGLDFAPAAIAHARGLFADRTDLRFDEGDLNALRPPDEPFDVAFALDSLYFATDLAQTLAGIALLVKPGGRLVAPYTQTVTEGRAPTEPDACTLGIALEQAGWDWVAVEASDEALWDREVTALAELQAQFEQEGSGDLWARREREASRLQACWWEERAIRWIFVAQRP